MKPSPAGRLRRAFLHLPYSMTLSSVFLTQSPVPYKSLYHAPAAFTPAVTRPAHQVAFGFSSRRPANLRFRLHLCALDASSAVHFHSASWYIPDGVIPTFSYCAQHRSFWPQHPVAVCNLHLIDDCGGPASISYRACFQTGSFLLSLSVLLPSGHTAGRTETRANAVRPYINALELFIGHNIRSLHYFVLLST